MRPLVHGTTALKVRSCVPSVQTSSASVVACSTRSIHRSFTLTCRSRRLQTTSHASRSWLSARQLEIDASITTGRRTTTTTAPTSNPPVALINDLPKGYQEVVVDFNDESEATRFPSFWLRDHCRCAECCHPQTKQRQLDTFALDPDTKAVEANVISPSTSAEVPESGLEIKWSGEPSHISIYPVSWLKRQTPFSSLPPSSRQNPRGKWKHALPFAPSYPSVDYNSSMTTDQGLSILLSQIRTYGFAFISNTPFDTPEATKQLAERIGTTIRHTHYGGFWEVVSEANPIDTAYTNLFLPNHTDNTYFTDPCGLQMFHCLSHASLPSPTSSTATSASTSTPRLGGESTLVDGFAAAAHLHKHDAAAYRLLSTVPILSHASGDTNAGPFFNNALHTAGHPVFTHLGSSASGTAYHHPRNLSQIRWNNCDRHEGTLFPSHATMMSWYAAARAWDSLVNPRPSSSPSGSVGGGGGGGNGSSEFEIVVKLQPGTPVVFDNWRVLHGRKAFEGVRRLCGAYIGMDDFLAKGRVVDERLGVRVSREREEEEEEEEEERQKV